MKTPAKKVTRKDYKAMKAENPMNTITPKSPKQMEGVTEEKVMEQGRSTMMDKTPVDMPVQPITSKLSYEDAAAKIKSNKTLLADFKAKKESTPKGKEFTMTIGGQTFRYKGVGEGKSESKPSADESRFVNRMKESMGENKTSAEEDRFVSRMKNSMGESSSDYKKVETPIQASVKLDKDFNLQNEYSKSKDRSFAERMAEAGDDLDAPGFKIGKAASDLIKAGRNMSKDDKAAALTAGGAAIALAMLNKKKGGFGLKKSEMVNLKKGPLPKPLKGAALKKTNEKQRIERIAQRED